MDRSNFDTLNQVLRARFGYLFKDFGILTLACTHKSFGNESRPNDPIETRDNERMEFLGDAVLDLVVSEELLANYREAPEGELSKLRASLVNEKILASIARDFGLGLFLLLGKGEEQTGGREKDSILASALEALVAGVFLESGFEAAKPFTKALFGDRIEKARSGDSLQDYKTRLQEVSQGRLRQAPKYDVIHSEGPDHDKTFHIELSIGGKLIAKASGKSKKEAEQNAAKIALDRNLKPQP